MAWPTTAVATGELITAAQLNGLPVMIANSTLSGDAASISFTSIPGHYAHLFLVCYFRSDIAAASSDAVLRFNSDTAGNYDHQQLAGGAATASAAEAFAATYIKMGVVPGNTAGANLFNAMTATVPHYANAANNKACATESALKLGTTTGSLVISAHAGFWRSNAAITNIQVFAASAANLKSGSRATLYGLA